MNFHSSARLQTSARRFDREVLNDQGFLIVNADDWGRDSKTTDQTLDCYVRGVLSSVSAMVFMDDSERAAAIALDRQIDAGLHLNFTTPFSMGASKRLTEHQSRISRFLSRWRFVQTIYHPGLANSFEYVVAAQLDEFHRLYGERPGRIDGHHHMHLCANVLLGQLLPSGTIVRRNFSFQRGEKNVANRLYRTTIDHVLARRHFLTDFFFSLPPIQSECHLERIFSTARHSVVEVETHPINEEEYQFLAEGRIFAFANSLTIAPCFKVNRHCSTVN